MFQHNRIESYLWCIPRNPIYLIICRYKMPFFDPFKTITNNVRESVDINRLLLPHIKLHQDAIKVVYEVCRVGILFHKLNDLTTTLFIGDEWIGNNVQMFEAIME